MRIILWREDRSLRREGRGGMRTITTLSRGPMLRPLATSGADHDQADSGDQCDCAEDGRDGEGVLRLMRDLQRSRVDNFLLVSEGDSAGSISDDAEKDEEYSDDGCCLHEEEPFVRPG